MADPTALPLYQAATLGIVQGLAEFLPISSSGHLIVIPWLFRWEDPGLSFDVALHLGTLAALVGYYFKDWVRLISAAARAPRSVEARILAYLALATLPGGLAGLFLEKYAENLFRSPLLIVATTVLFGLLLAATERWGKKSTSLENVTFWNALKIGLSQGLAIIPGVSRSGITITTGLFEGLDREAAAKFSFLLATPIIFGAGLHKLRHVPVSDLNAAFFVGIGCSAITGLLAIQFLISRLQRNGYRPYVWYRMAFGAAILGVYIARGG